MLNQDQKNLLTSPIHPSALKNLPGAMNLTAIDNYYIVERLNEVFGIGEWEFKCVVVESTDFQVVVRGTLVLPNGKSYTQYGGGEHSVKGNKFDTVDPRIVDRGNLYKSAATSALSKCSSYLGIGNEIYGMKYKKKQNQNSTPTTTTQPKPQKQIIRVGDEVKEERVVKMLDVVKAQNKGVAKLYGKDKNTLYTNQHKYILSPKQVNIAKKYGAIDS